MNAGFEDVLVLNEVLDETKDDLAAAIPIFAARRRPDGDAIGVLSYNNYAEMRSHTANTGFLLQKKVSCSGAQGREQADVVVEAARTIRAP
jgi:kynurenine 3-monooxygenase